MSLNVTTAEIPATASGRAKEPNPWDEHFPADEKALVVTVDGPADSKPVRKLTNQARAAATAVKRSARVKMDESTTGTGKNKKTVTTLTVWTVPQIKRPRQNDAPTNNATEGSK